MSLKLKFYDNSKLSKDEIYIGKSGQLRFKKLAVNEFGIEKGQRWLIATDENENPIKHLYLVKPHENQVGGFKVSSGNGTYHINMKGVVQELNLKVPLRCKYESFKNGEYEGIKLILPNK